MTVLVTGATGVVGRRVVERLVRAAVPVRALTRNPASAGLPPQVEVVRGDLGEPEGGRRCLPVEPVSDLDGNPPGRGGRCRSRKPGGRPLESPAFRRGRRSRRTCCRSGRRPSARNGWCAIRSRTSP
ncbi:NAD(P)H-binding protein [Actinomadura sp. WMMB 499]|nr:NAD(P)H-binding protein [Actinomadura sp. WMMB 499]